MSSAGERIVTSTHPSALVRDLDRGIAPGSVEESRDDPLHGELLRARLGVFHYRGMRLSAVRLLSLTAIPVWIQAHTRLLPGVLSWLACLLFGFAGAETALYAGLEEFWARRAGQRTYTSPGVSLHVLWSRRDEVCSGLGYGLGVVSIIPWGAVLSGASLPAEMLDSLTGLAVALAAIWGGLSR